MLTILERSTACLKGLVIGDAIGKQTEGLHPAQIKLWYPDGIQGFHGPPGTVIPRYRGKRYEWQIGETTDDTEQTIAVAQALLKEGCVTHLGIGIELMACRKSNRPTLSLGRFQQGGEPGAICFDGDGCGAAMRIAPVGIVYSYRRLSMLIEAAIQASIPTHGGSLALCAASAVAAAVSAAVDGQSPTDIVATAMIAAQGAEQYRPAASSETIAEALQRIYHELVNAQSELSARIREPDCFPDRTVVIVPLAISLAVVTRSAQETTLLAANLGGDSDSVAAIAGSIAGALRPDSVNDDWYRVVQDVNTLDMPKLARQLTGLRQNQ
jgi:ADP-ribosylglycohydrolase